ncbi:MAG: sigma 54-interacting transcriptional regulator [Planctomycetota bacterium]
MRERGNGHRPGHHDDAATTAAAPKLLGRSDAIAQLAKKLAAVADHDCGVLLRGESGVGKELAAHWIHAHSARRNAPFVPVDCTALPETLVESQLFGHEQGAYTGADHATLGFLRAAQGGTVFLDEIGELPLPSQAKLLRCIQERQVVPLGATEPIALDVRVIAATHRDLTHMAARGRFREDLMYRLDVANIELPPLRKRPEDIATLAEHFLRQAAERYQTQTPRLSPEARVALLRYRWPGNVRELANVAEHALVFGDGKVIQPHDLPDRLRHAPTPAEPREADTGLCTLAQLERQLIERALRITHGNQTRAAQLIGVERHRLHRKIVRYGIQPLTSRSQ